MAASALSRLWRPGTVSSSPISSHRPRIFIVTRALDPADPISMRSACTLADGASTPYVTTGRGQCAAIRATRGSSAHATRQPFSGTLAANVPTARTSPSSPSYASRCSSSTFVTTAISGARRRNDRSLSSASTTMNGPLPRRALPPRAPTTPPMTAVGSSPAASRTSATMDVVVVLPWDPATATALFCFVNSANIAPRPTMGIPLRRASTSSGLSGATADETTTTSGSATCAAACPSAIRIPVERSRAVAGDAARSDPLSA